MNIASEAQNSKTKEIADPLGSSVSTIHSLAPRHIFVLGEERTGTTSLHKYFLSHGIKSANQLPTFSPQDSSSSFNVLENRSRFLELILRSDCEAFSRYPIRLFYEQLYHAYPDAFFILTTRSSSERWIASMRHSPWHSAKILDEARLRRDYERLNQKIHSIFKNSDRKFLEICIDDDNEINSMRLSRFLGLSSEITLPHVKGMIKNEELALSRQHMFYNSPEEDPLSSVEALSSPFKGAISEYGWSYLINDTNNFLRVQFGNISWSNDERRAAANMLRSRVVQLTEMGANYKLFIVPEKSIVYNEYLPRRLADLKEAIERPALLLQEDVPTVVYYLEAYLRDARSFGQLYFRGDSHTNWHGAWFVYRFAITQLIIDGLLSNTECVNFSELLPSIAAYDGDLWTQLNEPVKHEFNKFWGFTSAQFGLEISVKLDLPKEKMAAQRIETPHIYHEWFSERETLVYERSDGIGPTVVIFRDSTVELCHHLLAQHFSRAVFVWHQGAAYREVIELERPDLVLHFIAERFLIRYPIASPIDTVRR
jgi:hypothetical protein